MPLSPSPVINHRYKGSSQQFIASTCQQAFSAPLHLVVATVRFTAHKQRPHLSNCIHQPLAQIISVDYLQVTVTITDQPEAGGASQNIFYQEEVGGELQ